MDIDSLKEERKNRLSKNKEEMTKKRAYIPFGVTLLDLSVGGGDAIDKGGMGVGVGDMVNVFGDTGVGKSFLFNEFIANARRIVSNGDLLPFGIKKLKWHYGDVEDADNFDTMKLYGFEVNPPDKDFVPNTVEDYCYHIQTMLNKLKDDELLIYIVDSLDALTSRELLKMNDDEVKAFEKGKAVDKGSFDLQKNKFLAQHFFAPIKKAREGKNAIILVVSQIRQKIGATMFEKKTTTSNTSVMQFYFDTRLELLPSDKYTKEVVLEETGEKFERGVGGSVRCNPVKVRHERPYRIVQFDYFYTYGLDSVGSNVDFLYGLRDDRYKLKTSADTKNLVFPPDFSKKSYESPTVPNIRDWVKEVLPESGVKSTTTKVELEEIIQTNNLYKQFCDKFGSGLDRDGIIQYIVDNDLEDELEQLVIAKWEAIEKPVGEINRKKKW